MSSMKRCKDRRFQVDETVVEGDDDAAIEGGVDDDDDDEGIDEADANWMKRPS